MQAPQTSDRAARNWRTEHAALQATIDTSSDLARRAHRIAPTPTGSAEIPSWLLALLVVLTIAALALFAPGVQA